MVGIRLQDWPSTETALDKGNLIIKSSIYTLPAFQPQSIIVK